MNQYLHLLQNDFPDISESDLFKPIVNTSIDSLDLVVIRVLLEKHFTTEVPDIIWYQCKTLAEALIYFEENKKYEIRDKLEGSDIAMSSRVEIRMPQMANSALSESWLLSFLGDNHWQLLTRGFVKKSSEFRDENRQRIYATFVRIRYQMSALIKFKENDFLEFESSIETYGNNTFLSSIDGRCEDHAIAATLMTTFSAREDNNNSKIFGSDPLGENIFRRIENMPLFLNEYRLLKKGLISELATSFGSFSISDDILFECDYAINPYYDINGVGLLYFAAYPIIADTCLLTYPKMEAPLEWHTVFRDVFYFNNCNPHDLIKFNLNIFMKVENELYIMSALYRKSDNKLLGKIFCIKQKKQ